MARKPVDPYAAAASPLSSANKAAAERARKRREALERRTRAAIAARRRREQEDLEILAADRTITIGDVAASTRKKKPPPSKSWIEQLQAKTTPPPPPKAPRRRGYKEPLTPKEQREKRKEDEALRKLRLAAARGAPLEETRGVKWREILRDTRPADLPDLFPSQPGKTVHRRRPGEPERPDSETVESALNGDKAAARAIKQYSDYWNKRLKSGEPLTENDIAGMVESLGFSAPGGRAFWQHAAGNVEEMARGAIPAAKVLYAAAKEDLWMKSPRDHDMDAADLRDLWEMGRWILGDTHNKRENPGSDSKLLAILGDSLRQWKVGAGKALPTSFDPEDWAEAKDYWGENPVYAALDVYPLGALISRPLSVASLTARMARHQGVSPALMARAIRESYIPGTEERKGRKGGIPGRVVKGTVGDEIVEAIGRPWSRTPITRAGQRLYDSMTEQSEWLARHRLARHEERGEREDVRRFQLDGAQLTEEISKFTFSDLGRFKAAFGPRGSMTPRERSRAVSLMSVFQLDRNLPIEQGLKAVQQDKLDILEAGVIDLPGGGTAKLHAADVQNLTREVNDIQRFLNDLEKSPKLADEMGEALGAMKVISDKVEESGLETMRRTMGDDAMPEIEAQWANRRGMLMRHLQGRGFLGAIDSPERNAWLEFWTERAGEGEARTLMALTDSIARQASPDAPASWYRDRAGTPTEMKAAEFVGEGYFQGPGRRQILGEGAGDFYSPLQRGIAEDPNIPNRQRVDQWKADIDRLTKREEVYNSGLMRWLDSMGDDTRIYKSEIQEHLSSYLNDYNLEEYYFTMGAGRIGEDSFETRWHDYGGNSGLSSREPAPGEYREIVMHLPRKGRDITYEGKGESHWEMENVVFHIRFHIFEEDGVRKLLVEEIQSDWASEARQARKLRGGAAWEPDTPEEAAAVRHLSEQREEVRQQLQPLSEREYEISEELRMLYVDAGGTTPRMRELRQEMKGIQGEMEQLKREFSDIIRQLMDRAERQVPPSPLGDSYYRTAIRRIAREAVDEGVDEIILTSGHTQFRRYDNSEPLDRTLPPVENLTDMPAESAWKRLYERDYPAVFMKEYGATPELRRNAYQGRLSFQTGTFSAEGDMLGTVIRVNDGMRQKAANAQRLYQQQPDYDALPRGATELLAGGRTAIRIFERGDPSTWIHELGHVVLHDLAPEDLAVIEKTLAGDKRLADWHSSDHERFARAFETYVRKGYAPTRSLQSVFTKLKNMIGEIWKVTGQKAEHIPAPVKAIFDDLFHTPEAGEPWGYVPHREFWDLAQSSYQGGVRPPAAGQTIGVARRDRKVVERSPNELLLYQTGRLSPDPAQLMDLYMNRERFAVTLDAREDLYFNKGVPVEEVADLKGGWLIRNPHEPAGKISPETQVAVRQGREEMAEALEVDEASVPGEDMFGGNYDEWRKDFVAKVSESPKWRNEPNVRWVPGDYVKTRFGDVFSSAPRGSVYSGAAMLNALQRTTGIYLKPFAYIAGNIPFNVMAMLASQPMSLFLDLPWAIKQRLGSPSQQRRWERMSSESGETRASAGLPQFYTRAQTKMQRAEEWATGMQQGIAKGLSEVADNPFRVAMFRRIARRKGYKTDRQLDELLDAETPQAKRDLHEVRQITRDKMLDFDALNPMQRKWARSALYLWPFIYASTKWPLMYAREYPVRAGVASQLLEEEGEKAGTIPQQIANLLKTRWGDIDLSTVNPLSPIADLMEGTQAFMKDPSRADLTVVQDRLTPTLAAVAKMVGGGAENSWTNLLRSTLPLASELAAWRHGDFRGSKIYGPERDLLDYLLQRHIRFYPRQVNEQVIQERIDTFRKDRLQTSTFEREKSDDWKKIQQYVKATGGYSDDDIAELRRSYTSWWNYQEATEEMKDSTGQRKLTPVQQIEILDEIVRENYPEMEDELWDVEPMRDPEYQRKYALELDEYIGYWKDIINEGRSMVFNDYRSYAADNE